MDLYALNLGVYRYWLPPKLLLIMKLVIVILFTCFMQVSAGTFAQRVTLSEKNVSIDKVLKQIKSQTGFDILYASNNLAHAKKISINVANLPIAEALAIVFEDQPLNYEVKDNTIFITRKIPSILEHSTNPWATISVRGRIVDKDGKPIPGASVRLKDKSKATSTNSNGEFNLDKVAEGAVLIISSIGYVTKEINVAKELGDIVLELSNDELDEVVVVGYGTQKKSAVTGAISTLAAKDVEHIPVPNLSSALAGRLSGVAVTAATGAPGYAPAIRVRSVNTWKGTGNDPLYVIDGVISDKSLFDAMDYSEVENISVLKDAASGAVYGARAANGVILVTTKRGTSGKPQFNYNYSFSSDNPSQLPEYVSLKDGVRLSNEARTAFGLTPGFDTEETAFFNETNPKNLKYDLASRNATLQRHAVSVSGGSDKVKYFLNGSFFDQSAFLKNTDFNKYNFRSNLEVNLTKDLTGEFNFSYNQSKNKRFAILEDIVNYWDGFEMTDVFGDFWARLLFFEPYRPAVTSDGKFINTGWVGNPVAFVEEGGTNTATQRNVNLLFKLNYKVPFLEGLSGSLQFSPNYTSISNKLFEVKPTLYNVVTKGSNGWIYTDEVTGTIQSGWPEKERLMRRQETRNNYQFNAAANYARKFGKHDVNAMLVYEQSEGHNDYFHGARENFPLVPKDQFWATSAARLDSYVDGNESENGRASFIGRFGYNYDEKYFVSATVRRDGSMLFGPDYRWGTFPSVSAGWVISNESFYNFGAVDFLKLRGSWGLTGNDAVGGWKWQESYKVSGGYLMGGTIVPTVGYGGIVNEQLTWEKSREINLGIEARFLKNFLVSADYFSRQNYDILDTRILSLPVSFGGTMPPENYGIVDGHGYELELGYMGTAGEFSYGIKGNFSYATNKVIKKDVAQNALDADNPNGRSTDYLATYESTGIIRTQAELDALPAGYTIFGDKPLLGGLNFEDVNGPDGVPDGKIDSYDKQVLKGRRTLNPYTYGLNLNGRWRGLAIDVFLQGNAGGVKDVWQQYSEMNILPQIHRLDSWTPENVDAAYPRLFPLGYTQDNTSSFWYKDYSYLRLQQVNISYSLPKKWIEGTGLRGISLMASGTNLFTFSKFDYYDPAVESLFRYPTMRTFSLSANIGF